MTVSPPNEYGMQPRTHFGRLNNPNNLATYLVEGSSTTWTDGSEGVAHLKLQQEECAPNSGLRMIDNRNVAVLSREAPNETHRKHHQTSGYTQVCCSRHMLLHAYGLCEHLQTRAGVRRRITNGYGTVARLFRANWGIVPK